MSILLLLLMVWPCLAETASDDSTAIKNQTQQKLELDQVPSVKDTSRVEQKEGVVVKKEEKPRNSKTARNIAIGLGAGIVVGLAAVGALFVVMGLWVLKNWPG